MHFGGTRSMPWLLMSLFCAAHDDVIKWKHFPPYWLFVQGIHRSLVNSTHKGQWREAFMFSFICALNKRLSKQSWGLWFEAPSRSLWRHCDAGNQHCRSLQCRISRYLSPTRNNFNHLNIRDSVYVQCVFIKSNPILRPQIDWHLANIGAYHISWPKFNSRLQCGGLSRHTVSISPIQIIMIIHSNHTR